MPALNVPARIDIIQVEVIVQWKRGGQIGFKDITPQKKEQKKAVGVAPEEVNKIPEEISETP